MNLASISLEDIPASVVPNIHDFAYRPATEPACDIWDEMGFDLQALLAHAFRLRHPALIFAVDWLDPQLPMIDGARHFALPFREEFLN